MTLLRLKQIDVADGSLVVGNAKNLGSVLPAGDQGTVLRVINGKPSWTSLDAKSVPFVGTQPFVATNVSDALDELKTSLTTLSQDTIRSADDKNRVHVANDLGAQIFIENANGDSKMIASFEIGTGTDENLQFTTSTGFVVAHAGGTLDDVSIALVPKGNGEVYIGGAGDTVLQADDGENISIFGGVGGGNVLLNGGGTGRVFYASTPSDPLTEIATKRDVMAIVSGSTNQLKIEDLLNVADLPVQNGYLRWNPTGDQVVYTEIKYRDIVQTPEPRTYYYDGDSRITVPTTMVPGTLTVYINGLIIDNNAIVLIDNLIAYNADYIGYLPDDQDQIRVSFMEYV